MSLASLLPTGFSASTYVAPEASAPRPSTPLPAGTYTVEITDAQVKPLKSGRGTGLAVEFSVIDPAQHAGRRVWQTLNIEHDNENTQSIALAELARLCKAVGVETPSEDALFQKILKVRTVVAPGNNGYEARAEVKGYEAAGTALPPGKPAPARAPLKPSPVTTGTGFDNMTDDVPY